MGQEFLVVLFVIVMLISVFLLRYQEKKRNKSFEEIARNIGVSFTPKDDGTLIEQLSEFELFKREGNIFLSKPSICNLIHGAIDSAHASIFDYEHRVKVASRNYRERQTVAFFQSDQFNFPQLYMLPESLSSKIETIYKHKDINFSNFPTFSKKYLLLGKDEAQIRNLFNFNVLSFFDNQYGWSVEGSEKRLLIYRARKRVPTNKLQEFFEQVYRIFQLFSESKLPIESS